MLFGASAFLAIVGHCSVSRVRAARPYRTAWKHGVTWPLGASAAVVAICGLTCMDTQSTQELPLLICLLCVSALALAVCTRLAVVRSRDPARWLYIGLLPYHGVVVLGVGMSLLYSLEHGTNAEGVGPLMVEEFVVQWEMDPQPGSVMCAPLALTRG